MRRTEPAVAIRFGAASEQTVTLSGVLEAVLVVTLGAYLSTSKCQKMSGCRAVGLLVTAFEVRLRATGAMDGGPQGLVSPKKDCLRHKGP